MPIWIEITDGPKDLGRKFEVVAGTTIGRSRGDIRIDDAKISAMHALVVVDNRGGLVLIDQNSSNGIWQLGDRKDQIPLQNNSVFQIGKTHFRVIIPQPKPISPAPVEIDWRKALRDQILALELSPNLDSENLPVVSALEPMLRLVFVEGFDAGKEILLGFAPRRIGTETLDIDISELGAPPEAFVIDSREGRALFSTQHSRNVFLNEASMSTSIINDQDTVRIGKTLIRLEFVMSPAQER